LCEWSGANEPVIGFESTRELMFAFFYSLGGENECIDIVCLL